MLYYDRIDISEGNDGNKTSLSKDGVICHYWYFLNYSFKFQPNICNRCQDLLMISINLSNIAVLNFKGFDYCCVISLIRKNEATKMLIWPKKEEHYKKVENYGLKKYKTFDSIYKNGKDDKIW